MINLVLALDAEARPIINHFGLKKIQNKQPFPIYTSSGYQLIISGVGRCNSAAATTWLASFNHSDSASNNKVWVNIGIAGHKNKPLGDVMCCHKITEHSTNKNWYPVQLKSALQSADLLTVDQVTANYTDNSLHDMEASGFYSSALRFTTAELAQCVKIVSDNETNAVENINKKLVNDLIGNNLEKIEIYADSLREFSLDSAPPDVSKLEKAITNRWKFSVTQTRQLQRLLQRYIVLIDQPDQLRDELQSESLNQSSQVLKLLREKMNQYPIEVS